MAYIPHHAKWYVAEIVLEITVAGDPRNVLHRNLVLVRADSPEEAYAKALALGRDSEASDVNPEGFEVQFRFRGLAALNVIHDELEHGAELLYEESVGVKNEEVEKWIPPKEQLGVFRSIEPRDVPDYSSKEVMDEAEALLRNSRK